NSAMVGRQAACARNGERMKEIFVPRRFQPKIMAIIERANTIIEEFVSQGQVPLVLHLADHDPNGLDMTRDVRARLALYTGTEVEVRRLALNIAQVRRHRLPHNFAKEADTRYAAYVREFGRHCWELDALSPTVLNQLIRTELEGLIDQRAWRR